MDMINGIECSIVCRDNSLPSTESTPVPPLPGPGSASLKSNTIDESFDIGSDTRTAVDDSYKLPYNFSGTIQKLTFKLGPEQLTAEERKVAEHVLASAHD
jgi:hypothetical protein